MNEEIQEPTEAENQSPETPQESDGVEYESQEEEQEQETQPEEKETPAEDPEKLKKAFDKKIARMTFQRKEEERRRIEAEEKLKKFESKPKAKSDIPDAYDPNYEAKLNEYIKTEAERIAESKLQVEQRQAALRQEQEQIAKSIEKMKAGATKYGITSAELDEADKRVAMFIRDPQLARYILSHDKSPLIIKHLANSIDELENISGMNAVDAAAYIASTVAPNAEKLRPKVTKTPKPLDIPKGRGAGEKKDRFLEGVTFE